MFINKFVEAKSNLCRQEATSSLPKRDRDHEIETLDFKGIMCKNYEIWIYIFKTLGNMALQSWWEQKTQTLFVLLISIPMHSYVLKVLVITNG